MAYGFSFAVFGKLRSAYIVCGDTTRLLTLLKLWVAESSTLLAKPDSDVVIDDFHARYCGCPEDVSTSFTARKRYKGARRVKFNALTFDDGHFDNAIQAS